MNILIPDSWLREYLKTKATPRQITDYTSLCGPSVERINKVSDEVVYEIEVTSNRPDSMSVAGFAREAAAILPRFGVKAELINDPYKGSTLAMSTRVDPSREKKLTIATDRKLNPRFTAIVIDQVKVGPSPEWLRRKLELTGIRSLNNVVDVTNYLMRAIGQPAHAFDYDSVKPKNGRAAMTLRSSVKGEKITTLDGKTYTLTGGDIVIEDGEGRLIDLCGIMGAANSRVKEITKTIVLFMQTYDPVRIRKTSTALSLRTEASALFEKGLDSELVLPAIVTGTELILKFTKGRVASKLCDIYDKPYRTRHVSVDKDKINAYLGTQLPNKVIRSILAPLGFTTAIGKRDLSVAVPSFRPDVTVDVDVIEEIARLYGFHNIVAKLPDAAPPTVTVDPMLLWEEEIKIRLRDWGYTELYTYSMISEELMTTFGFDLKKAYKITNPLSNEWVYMRPSLLPSVLSAILANLHMKPRLKLFELSMVYRYREKNLPDERPILLVAWSGERYYEAKGLAQALFHLLGREFPAVGSGATSAHYHPKRSSQLDSFGTVGEVHPQLLESMGTRERVTILELDLSRLIPPVRPQRTYIPIPKYPAMVEDLAFFVTSESAIGPMIEAFKKASTLVRDVTLLDAHKDTRTFHITYLARGRNLTTEDVRPVREKLIKLAEQKFGATFKTA